MDPKKLEETFRKVGLVIDEISDRIDSNEYDMLDARVAKDAVREKVKEVLAQRELSIEEYKILSGITSAPGGGLKIMGTEFTRQAVRDIFEQVEKVRRDRRKVGLPPSIWEPSTWKPIVPIEPLKPLRNEWGLQSRAHWMSKGAGLGTGFLTDDEAVAIPDIEPMALADTTAVVPNSDPYRTAGKRTIENVLDEAGIDYKIIIHLALDEDRWEQEHLNEDQRALLTEIEKIHPNISCLYDLPGTAVAVFETKRPNIFRRLWDGLVLRFGRAMTGIE